MTGLKPCFSRHGGEAMQIDNLELRDLLAAFVAAGLASSDHWNPNSSTSRQILARQAYGTADELLVARSVNADPNAGSDRK